MAYITKDSPEYQASGLQSEQGAWNPYDVYLNQLPMTEDYWRQLGYTGPMDAGSIQNWMSTQGLQYGVDGNSAMNALMDGSGNMRAGSQYSVDDTGDFARDAALVIGGGYFGGNALAGAGGGSSAAMANGAVMGGATGAGVGGATAAGYGGLAAGSAGAASSLGSSGSSSSFQLDPNSYGGANYSGSNMAGNSGSTLADFFSGNGNWNDYLRAGQAAYGMYSQNKATDAAMQGNANQLALQREMWQANQAENKPLVDMRNSVLPQIQNLLQNPSSITSQPDYQFGLQQGANRMNNRAAASGNYYSGAQMKAANQYGQDYAGTKLDQSLNRLMGVASGTQIGSNQNQAANQQFAVGGGNALQQGGNIRAGGYIGQYNTVNNNLNDWMQDQTNRKYWGGGS